MRIKKKKKAFKHCSCYGQISCRGANTVILTCSIFTVLAFIGYIHLRLAFKFSHGKMH